MTIQSARAHLLQLLQFDHREHLHIILLLGLLLEQLPAKFQSQQ
jgi:hypothetical protein